MTLSVLPAIEQAGHTRSRLFILLHL